MSIAVMCGFEYTRPSGEAVACTYVSHHSKDGQPTPHSWRALKMEDEYTVLHSDQAGIQVGMLLEAIARGDLDKFLEAILAGAHERKRARRGVILPSGRLTT